MQEGVYISSLQKVGMCGSFGCLNEPYIPKDLKKTEPKQA